MSTGVFDQSDVSPCSFIVLTQILPYFVLSGRLSIPRLRSPEFDDGVGVLQAPFVLEIRIGRHVGALAVLGRLTKRFLMF